MGALNTQDFQANNTSLVPETNRLRCISGISVQLPTELMLHALAYEVRM